MYLDTSFIICGMGPDLTIVDGAGASPPLIRLSVDEGEVTLEGFTLTGGSPGRESAITVLGKGSRVTLRNLRVFNAEGDVQIDIGTSSGSKVRLEGVTVQGGGVGLEITSGRIKIVDASSRATGMGWRSSSKRT